LPFSKEQNEYAIMNLLVMFLHYLCWSNLKICYSGCRKIMNTWE